MASVLATDDEDPLFPTYRETAALLSRGVPLSRILQYWSGDERGSCWSRDRNVFPIFIPVGSQGLHAVGAVKALQHRGEPGRPVVYFGEGHLVDDNDLLATYQVIRDLRSGESADQPVFVEAVTYRYGDHTTSDDADRYRHPEELERWRREDPVRRLRRLLEDRHGWSEEDEQELYEELNGRIDGALEEFRSLEEPNPGDIFEYTFESMPESLRRQREQVRKEGSDD